MIFIMLTRLIGKEVHSEKNSLEELKQRVEDNIAANCPGVTWLSNYALLGPKDYLDIFTAPDIETALKIADIVRNCGSASTEIWPEVSWQDFKKIIGTLPKEDR